MSRRLPHVVDPSHAPYFPDDLVPDRYGIVAVGGALTQPVLLEAYAKGIFPWHDDPVPFWFSPDPRMVLYPERYHASARLQRVVRQRRFAVRFDNDFDGVIQGCAAIPRPGQDGTWISSAFRRAYTALFESGYAHCVSVHTEDRLVGGLYGVSLGAAFFGESMFSRAPNASKVAMFHLVQWCRTKDLAFIDCQVPTPHLLTLGAVEVPRSTFLAELRRAMEAPTLRGRWEPETRGPGGTSGLP